LIGADEVAFLPDLQLFLGRQDVGVPLPLAISLFFCVKRAIMMQVHAGRVPSVALDDWVEHVNSALNDSELSLQVGCWRPSDNRGFVC